MRTSRLPGLVGLCSSDIVGVANYVNSAQDRLKLAPESGDDGWWGSWAEAVFNVSHANPYITLAREMARIDLLTVCDRPVEIRNQFYEYLRFGNGRMAQDRIGKINYQLQAYERNTATTFFDPPTAPFSIRVFTSNPLDVANGSRVFLQGTDNNGLTIYTLDGSNQVQGEYVNLETPFATSLYNYESITGIQKDVTLGVISFFAVDPVTGISTLLLTMEPGEQTASYRRYYLNNLPSNCPNLCNGTFQVKGLVKLELIPVQVDQDYCLIQNREALIEEAQAVRYSEMDSASAKSMAEERHQQAIRLLNGEIRHYMGFETPAIRVSLFGSNRLRRQPV